MTDEEFNRMVAHMDRLAKWAAVIVFVGLGISIAKLAWGQEIKRKFWIEERHGFCCSEADCKPLAITDVRMDERGYLARSPFDRETWLRPSSPDRVFPTRDPLGRPWACVVEVNGDQIMRCLFIPVAG